MLTIESVMIIEGKAQIMISLLTFLYVCVCREGMGEAMVVVVWKGGGGSKGGIKPN